MNSNPETSTLSSKDENIQQTHKDPYGHIEDENQLRRVISNISVEDFRVLKNVMLTRGAIQLSVNNLLKGLIDELRANGINERTAYDPTLYATFATILRRRSAFNPVGQRPLVNESGGTHGVCEQPEKLPTVSSGDEGQTRKGRLVSKVKQAINRTSQGSGR
jgi:hypothetical protein